MNESTCQTLQDDLTNEVFNFDVPPSMSQTLQIFASLEVK